ncbi:MAG: Spy/CpxP family protein refolding chaperone [Rhodocyclales bacterium]|nr:Spy/CpxP family protein refolding chaperone [Rhodocyclales bacterium]
MGGMGGGPPGGGPGGRPRGPVMASGSHLVASMEQQLDNLRFQLKLRPEQESAWLTYQEKVGALVADQLRPAAPAVIAAGNALRQIDRKTDVVRNRLAALEDIGDAARRLYDKLDETQRATADRLLAATVPALYSGLAAERPEGDGRGRGGPGRPGQDDRGPPPD